MFLSLKLANDLGLMSLDTLVKCFVKIWDVARDSMRRIIRTDDFLKVDLLYEPPFPSFFHFYGQIDCRDFVALAKPTDQSGRQLHP